MMFLHYYWAGWRELCSCNLGIFTSVGHKPLPLTWKILCSFHLLLGGVRVVWFGGDTGGGLAMAKNPEAYHKNWFWSLKNIPQGSSRCCHSSGSGHLDSGVHLALLLDNNFLSFYFLPCEFSIQCMKVAISCWLNHSNQLYFFLVFRPVDPLSVIISWVSLQEKMSKNMLSKKQCRGTIWRNSTIIVVLCSFLMFFVVLWCFM